MIDNPTSLAVKGSTTVNGRYLVMNVPEEKLIQIKLKVIDETKQYVVLIAYIAMIMFGLKIYKRMILQELDVSYFGMGFSLFEAMILAKIIMLGDFLKIGERFNDSRLIIKTVYKSFCMSLLSLVFSIIEYSIEGLFDSRELSGILQEIMQKGKGEMLAHTLIIFINFIPLFAMWETGRVIGGNELFELLFRKR